MSQASELFGIVAGQHPSGEPVIEQLEGLPTGEEKTYRLTKSPAFVRGLATGDVIKLTSNPPGTFQLVERAGNLAVRVFSKDHLAEIAEGLVPAMEKLGAQLDIESERLLAFTVHVSLGFKAIEEILDRWVDGVMGVWQYGNVYADDGEPLNWWNEAAFTE